MTERTLDELLEALRNVSASDVVVSSKPLPGFGWEGSRLIKLGRQMAAKEGRTLFACAPEKVQIFVTAAEAALLVEHGAQDLDVAH